jgi:hypothetical protein
MTASFLHPSIPFLLAALLIPFIRTDKYRWLLPLRPWWPWARS